ncbi:MAG: thiolase family protein [Planctomycetota bacterium]|nr:thiolase family protein [Planctomycetota bacterium]
MSSTPNRRVVITHALRTPIGRYLGAFADFSAADLGASLVTDLITRSKVDPDLVTRLYFGNGRQAGGGPNLARQVAVRGGLGNDCTAVTVNMACGSGLESIGQAADWIRLGRARAVVAGGAESMSGLPFMLPGFRRGYRLGHAPVVDSMYKDGFVCPLADMVMGETAEKLAKERNLSRDEQDGFALSSQQKAGAAIVEGRFDAEMSPVTVVKRKSTTVIDADEHPRPSATLEGLGKLATVFDAESGTVTAGNASGITDGAAGVLLMDEDLANEQGLEILAYVGESRDAGVDPTIMGIGPIPAVRALSEANGMGVGDYDLVELNEAFAAQVLACNQELEIPSDRLNVNGGAIALGHPIGATGCRIVVTLLHEMQRRDVQHGLATLCISGGMGLASAFHRQPID